MPAWCVSKGSRLEPRLISVQNLLLSRSNCLGQVTGLLCASTPFSKKVDKRMMPANKGVRSSQVVLVVKNLPASAGSLRDAGLIPGLGRASEEGVAVYSSILTWRVP